MHAYKNSTCICSLQTTHNLGDNYAIERIVRLVGIMVRLLVSGNIESYSHCDELLSIACRGQISASMVILVESNTNKHVHVLLDTAV